MTPDRMESASVPETNDANPDMVKPDIGKPDTAKPDTVKPDTAKPDEARAEGGLARAYDRIKSAEEDLARLDRLVSGMERDGERPQTAPANAAAKAAETPRDAETPDKITPAPVSTVRNPGLKGNRPMLRALLILVLAIGVLGAAVASQYREEATSLSKSIMARLVPPASQPPRASAAEPPAQPAAVQLAAADQPNSVPAPPRGKDTDVTPKADSPGPDVPKAEFLKADAPKADGPRTSAQAPDPSSPDLAQSLKTVTTELANITTKLEQLKSRNEQALRDQADTIQQLKAAQEKDAADNARLAAQVQALQTQLTASPASAAAKPAVRSVNMDAAARARPHVPDAPPPRRPRPPPRERWMPPPYMGGPYYGDPDW
ncbi:hypothetical protein [Bradyrhizobium sp. WYCCWR 13022]|uniref:hypothetical protein n=2 Tax=unclassified Bradyrhizobium TaxID=2631580 RepID=UPI00345F2816